MSYDKQELRIYIVILLGSVVPTLLLWCFWPNGVSLLEQISAGLNRGIPGDL